MENRRRYTQRIDLVFVLKIFGSSSCLLGFEIFSAFHLLSIGLGWCKIGEIAKKRKAFPVQLLGPIWFPLSLFFIKK